MDSLVPSFLIHSITVFGPDVGLSQMAALGGFVIHPSTFCHLTGEFNPLTFKVVTGKDGLASAAGPCVFRTSRLFVVPRRPVAASVGFVFAGASLCSLLLSVSAGLVSFP